MKGDAALMYAQASSPSEDTWETEEQGSYDVTALHQEYRERLYSERALALMSARADRAED